MESDNILHGVVGGTQEDPWMATYTGTTVNVLWPQVEQIHIVDIAHQLALQTRYNGCCIRFYSIAEHCVRASFINPEKYAFEKLMHDAAEAYLGDLIRPLKITEPLGSAYKEIEHRMETCIAMRYNLEYPWPKEVKRVDRIMLFTEKRDNTNSRNPWYGEAECPALPEKIVPWSWEVAKDKFLERFAELAAIRGDGRSNGRN